MLFNFSCNEQQFVPQHKVKQTWFGYNPIPCRQQPPQLVVGKYVAAAALAVGYTKLFIIDSDFDNFLAIQNILICSSTATLAGFYAISKSRPVIEAN